MLSIDRKCAMVNKRGKPRKRKQGEFRSGAVSFCSTELILKVQRSGRLRFSENFKIMICPV